MLALLVRKPDDQAICAVLVCNLKLMEIYEHLQQELILLQEDPEGEYRGIPSWAASEFDRARIVSVISVLAHFGPGPTKVPGTDEAVEAA